MFSARPGVSLRPIKNFLLRNRRKKASNPLTTKIIINLYLKTTTVLTKNNYRVLYYAHSHIPVYLCLNLFTICYR